MRKICLLFALTFIVFNATAQLLLHEPFDYTPSTTSGLSAQSGAAWLTVNTGDSILVDAGSLTYAGLPASTGNKVKYDSSGTDYYRVFSSQTTGTVYSSFILNVSSLGSLSTTGGYFTGFIQDASTTAFGATVWTRRSTTAGKYNIGIATRTTGTAVSWLAADLDPGTSYFIVRAYDIIAGTGNDVARIWLNTTAIGGSEPTADATAVVGTDLTSIARVFMRQDNATNTPFIEIDEIRVGTTWASVTPGSGPVPSLSISTPLTAFGNVCINTTAGPNSFTITGSNLTTAPVTVAALPGFTYSTTSGGTYTSTLSLTQPGGAFSQQVFVKFDPVAAQSYNGNIAVAGGGVTTPVNAAAAGTGVNTTATVTTGGATAITMNSATAAGTITAIGCSPVTAYGIEYSTTAGFPNGTGTQVASTNLAAGNFTSDLTGLTQGTTYYYKAYATNSGGTTYGSEQSFTTATPNPTINTTALTSFGNTCINSTAGPNSFIISGTNLTNANITVGPLGGYTFSTTSGGTYTTSLSLTQPGGTYSQEIFVKFTPTALQSYSGNIPVGGGGTTGAVNVAVIGNGINSAPTVTTGAASGITTTTATLAGSITSNGCSAVTAYGIEYSLTSGFANGTGTPVPASNLTGGNFSAAVSGLTPNTTYYYKAYATNGGGTSYGAQQSFTTSAPPPPVLTVTSLTGFGNVCLNTTAGPNSFNISGADLTSAPVNVGPLAGYTFSTTALGTYTPTLSIPSPTVTGGVDVFVKFTPVNVQSYNGNIPVSGGGASVVNVAVTGTGVNTGASAVTAPATDITTSSAQLNGSITAIGCSNVTAYGFEYSGISGFSNGIDVPATFVGAVIFNAQVTGLVQGATYYYKAYVVNAAGKSYGAQESFTVGSIPSAFTVFPVPAIRGQEFFFSKKDVKPGYYGLLFFNSEGKLVYQKDINVQANFINQSMTIPATLPVGVYRLQLVNFEKLLDTRSILIL